MQEDASLKFTRKVLTEKPIWLGAVTRKSCVGPRPFEDNQVRTLAQMSWEKNILNKDN